MSYLQRGVEKVVILKTIFIPEHEKRDDNCQNFYQKENPVGKPGDSLIYGLLYCN